MIQAPTLETLHVVTYIITVVDNAQLNEVTNALHQPGYLLSPNRLVTVDLCLPADGIKLLNKSAYVTEILLSFNSESVAQLILDYICNGSSSPTASPSSTRTGRICPLLGKLRMRFRFVATRNSHDEWRKRTSTAIEERRKNQSLI